MAEPLTYTDQAIDHGCPPWCDPTLCEVIDLSGGPHRATPVPVAGIDALASVFVGREQYPGGEGEPLEPQVYLRIDSALIDGRATLDRDHAFELVSMIIKAVLI